jgi:hypothetical protein
MIQYLGDIAGDSEDNTMRVAGATVVMGFMRDFFDEFLQCYYILFFLLIDVSKKKMRFSNWTE